MGKSIQPWKSITSVMAVEAEDDWVINVRNVPANTKIIIERNPNSVNESTNINISGLSLMFGTPFLIKSSPIKRIPNPIMASARFWSFSFPKNMKGKKIPISIIAIGVICILKPKIETIHAVTVVPMFAPIMTPVDSKKVMSPAFTKLTTITVVVLEDCVMVVAPKPVSIPRNRVVVIPLSIALSFPPATFCNPSLKTFIP
jgi:hypothetical protein